VLSVVGPLVARAQVPAGGGTITGTVRDSASRPVANADVVARPGSHRTRSDSAGHFVLTGLGDDTYKVVARKLGYAPADWDVKLSNSGHVDIQLVLDHRLPMLDTMVVTAGRTCSSYSLDGFVCRRRSGGGTFLDYTDIDDKEALYTADIFRDEKGFRVDVRSTRYGPIRVAATAVPWGCITSLVDGRPVSAANAIPEFPWDLLAMEIYAKADSVPKEYQRYTWPEGGNLIRSGRCSVVVYWTLRARTKP
jgi:hypothetical protein